MGERRRASPVSKLRVQATRLSPTRRTGIGTCWACTLPIFTGRVHAGDEAEPPKKLQGEEEEQQIIMLPSTRRRSHARRKKALARAQVREWRTDPLNSRHSTLEAHPAETGCGAHALRMLC